MADVIPFEPRGGARYSPLDPKLVGMDVAHVSAALSRAELRIAQLEQSLVDALRDSAANWARARRAERRLEEREKAGATG